MFSPKKWIFLIYSITDYNHSFHCLSWVYKHIILNINLKVNKKLLTSNSDDVIIVSDRVIKHDRVNHVLE